MPQPTQTSPSPETQLTFRSEQQSFYFDNGAVENRVIHHSSQMARERFVFVPNWLAEPGQWKAFIKALTEHYPMDYFESREKPNTHYKAENISFVLEDMAQDLASYLNQIDGPYHLVGTAVGASTIIKAWSLLRHKPQTVVFICPMMSLKMPAYFRLLPFVSEKLILKSFPLIKLLLKRSTRLPRALRRIFREKDRKALRLIKASVEGLLPMQVSLSEVKRIDRPSLILYTLDDDMHTKADAEAMARSIPACISIGFEDFRTIHRKESALAICEWLNYRVWTLFAFG